MLTVCLSASPSPRPFTVPHTQPAISPHRAELSQKGKTVLITGGHTGIGFPISRAFSQAGADKIIIVGRRDDLVASAASRLASEFSTQVVGRACDIVDLASVEQLWKDLAIDGTLVDVLVLNAGKVTMQPILNIGRDTAWGDYFLHVRSNLDFVKKFFKQPGAENRPKVAPRQ